MSRLKFVECEGNYTGIINKRNKESLGAITYYKRWKQFIFEPEEDTVYSVDCLQEIIDYLKKKEAKTL